MTVWTKKLTSLRCLAGSRYQSLYRQISENQHKNLVGLAHELHNQDREKYNEFKPFSNPQFDLKNDKKQLRDWIEIHDTTINFGSPELSDHTSGFIYMSVSMYEDKSSIALRIADQVSDFDDDELLIALEQCQRWSNETVSESYTLQTIVKNLDKECSKRLTASMGLSQGLRLAFLTAQILPQMKESKLLAKYVTEERMICHDDLVKYLLILGFHGPLDMEKRDSYANLFHRSSIDFESYSPTELAVIYSGLRCLVGNNGDSNSALMTLGDRIKRKFGFRFN